MWDGVYLTSLYLDNVYFLIIFIKLLYNINDAIIIGNCNLYVQTSQTLMFLHPTYFVKLTLKAVFIFCKILKSTYRTHVQNSIRNLRFTMWNVSALFKITFVWYRNTPVSECKWLFGISHSRSVCRDHGFQDEHLGPWYWNCLLWKFKNNMYRIKNRYRPVSNAVATKILILVYAVWIFFTK